MKILGVVFDKDGTLIDLPSFWFGPVSHTIGILQEEYGFGETTAKELLIASGMRPDGSGIPEGLVMSGTNLDIAKAWKLILQEQGITLKDDFVETSRYMLASNAEHGTLQGMTDLSPLLSELRSRDLKIGIVTSDDYEQTRYSMEELGVLEFFDTIIGADLVENPKPAADSMGAIVSAWGIPKESILMVGDSVNDMKFAAQSGVAGVYFHEEEMVIPEGASYDITDLNEVIEVLDQIENETTDFS